MSSYVGISPKDPTKYLGPNVYLESIVTRNREPTGADLRLGTTGKYYPIGSLWLIGKNPTTGTEGDLWYLSKIVANVAYWIDFVGGLIPIEVLNGDTGFASGSTINILANPTSGSSVSFIGDNASTLSLNVTDSNNNTLIGLNCGNSSISGSNNTGLSSGSLQALLTGSSNTAIGVSSGSSYTGSESSNICISNTGTISESNTTRIGTQGSGSGQQNRAFIAGITGVSVSNLNLVTINTATGQLGAIATQLITQIISQIFTSSGTYTPTTGMSYCIIEVIGAGGGSGGCETTAADEASAAGGGGAGGYARLIVNAATIGASKTVTIGAGGTAGSAGYNPGGTGGTSSVGAIVSATGGNGGAGSLATTTGGTSAGGVGGIGISGDINVSGAPGQYGIAGDTNSLILNGGCGGSSVFGGGAIGSSALPATAGKNYGSGAGSGSNYHSRPDLAGAVGSDGIVIITEFVNV